MQGEISKGSFGVVYKIVRKCGDALLMYAWCSFRVPATRSRSIHCCLQRMGGSSR